MQTTTNNQRFESLDSLRGLASLQVVLHHLFLSIPIIWTAFISTEQGVGYTMANPVATIFVHSPLHVAWSGAEAVILFFVLSGFVLSLPFYTKENKPFNFTSFLIKRFFRLYFPYIITILVAIGLRTLLYSKMNDESLSEWFRDMWKQALSWNDITDLMLFNGNYHNIDTVLWSLEVELKVSIIFPAIMLVYRKLSLKAGLAVIGAYVLFYHGMVKIGVADSFPPFRMLYYVTFFLIGACIAGNLPRLLRLLSQCSSVQIVSILSFAILLYTFKWNVYWVPAPVQRVMHAIPNSYIIAFASSILILLACTLHGRKLLSGKAILHLGKISFSLYLLHPIIMLSVIYLLYPTLSLPVLMIISLAFSLGAAHIYYYVVESTFMKCGRMIASKVAALSKKEKYITSGS